jgi:hypothetical protein
MLRNACIITVLLVWFALVVVLSLARLWAVVVPLIALGGMVEMFAHEAIGARWDAQANPAVSDQLAVQVEPDECGYHAIVLDAADVVAHITDSHASIEEAARAAWEWIERQPMTQRKRHRAPGSWR